MLDGLGSLFPNLDVAMSDDDLNQFLNVDAPLSDHDLNQFPNLDASMSDDGMSRSLNVDASLSDHDMNRFPNLGALMPGDYLSGFLDVDAFLSSHDLNRFPNVDALMPSDDLDRFLGPDVLMPGVTFSGTTQDLEATPAVLYETQQCRAAPVEDTSSAQTSNFNWSAYDYETFNFELPFPDADVNEAASDERVPHETAFPLSASEPSLDGKISSSPDQQPLQVHSQHGFHRQLESRRGEVQDRIRVPARPQPGVLGVVDIWSRPRQTEPPNGYAGGPNRYPSEEDPDRWLFHWPGDTLSTARPQIFPNPAAREDPSLLPDTEPPLNGLFTEPLFGHTQSLQQSETAPGAQGVGPHQVPLLITSSETANIPLAAAPRIRGIRPESLRFIDPTPRSENEISCIKCQIDHKSCVGSPVCDRCQKNCTRLLRNPDQQVPLEDMLFHDIDEWRGCLCNLRAIITAFLTPAMPEEDQFLRVTWMRAFRNPSSPAILCLTTKNPSLGVENFIRVVMRSPAVTDAKHQLAKGGDVNAAVPAISQLQFETFLDDDLCADFKALHRRDFGHIDLSLITKAIRCSGYLRLLYNLDWTVISTTSIEDLIGKTIAFELIYFFVYQATELYRFLATEIQAAFDASQNQTYPRTALCALGIVVRSLRPYKDLAWDCEQLVPLETLLHRLRGRSGAFLQQVQRFEAQISSTQCRHGVKLPGKALAILKTGKKQPVILRVGIHIHKPGLTFLANISPFQTDGWGQARSFVQVLREKSIHDFETEAKFRQENRRQRRYSEANTTALAAHLRLLDTGTKERLPRMAASDVASSSSFPKTQGTGQSNGGWDHYKTRIKHESGPNPLSPAEFKKALAVIGSADMAFFAAATSTRMADMCQAPTATPSLAFSRTAPTETAQRSPGRGSKSTRSLRSSMSTFVGSESRSSHTTSHAWRKGATEATGKRSRNFGKLSGDGGKTWLVNKREKLDRTSTDGYPNKIEWEDLDEYF